jgi:DNA invertase Pin-like site-specific DNA recombinase/ssDNA-binding Zn-finger/Zn-ribbon topoisomerase 1
MDKVINNIAIYLRKSRGDDPDVLSKHRQMLTDYADKQGWDYIIYEENILSGERLSTRPKMLQVLDDVEDGKYNAILVAAYDRLSRGSSKDFGTIIEVLQYANCYIATPERVYDTNNTNDLTMLGIQGVFANTELRTIVKRLVDGKKNGAKAGKWTNGKPPYPYEYKKKVIINDRGKEEVSSEIIINPEKRKVYELIKEMYLAGQYGTEKIMVELNKMGYPSPGGTTWNTNTIQRLLLHEFHMGYSIYGKEEWKKGRDNVKRATRKRDKDEWFIGRGDWEILKTEEEHRKIMRIMRNNTKIPPRARAGVFPTSGLMYCKKCGYAMRYSDGRKEARTGKTYNYTKCNHISPVGDRCPQRGVKMTEEFYEVLYNAVITSHLDMDIIKRTKSHQEDILKKETMIADLGEQLKKHNDALARIKEAYVMEVYNLTEFAEEKKKLDAKIKNVKKEIRRVEDEISSATIYTKQELDAKIELFKQNWLEATTTKEQNDLLKIIVKRIFYDRQGDNVVLEIEYL